MKKLTHDQISEKRNTLDSLPKVKKLPVYVILNSIRSNYNVGSIFRTSDGAMIKKLYLCGYTPHPPKKEIMKTALGATESVNWEYVEDPKKVIKELKSKGIKICALELTDSSFPHYNIKSDSFPLALIVGNEEKGIRKLTADKCDFLAKIPMTGKLQSLNVSVATGILLFHIQQQRGRAGKK